MDKDAIALRVYTDMLNLVYAFRSVDCYFVQNNVISCWKIVIFNLLSQKYRVNINIKREI